MKSNIQSGFFVMADTHNIFREHSLVEAKHYCNLRILNFVEKHPNTNPDNILKAQRMISNAKSIAGLAQAVANYVLAHPSEGLRTI